MGRLALHGSHSFYDVFDLCVKDSLLVEPKWTGRCPICHYPLRTNGRHSKRPLSTMQNFFNQVALVTKFEEHDLKRFAFTPSELLADLFKYQ